MLILHKHLVHYKIFLLISFERNQFNGDVQVAYESRCEELQRELLQLTSVKQKVETEYSTLKKTVQKKEQEEERRKSMLEVRSSSPDSALCVINCPRPVNC